MTAFAASISYLKLDPLRDGRTFRLIESVTFTHGDFRCRVPAGFETDFASIPGIGRIFLPKWGKYGWAAILHDFLYSNHPGARGVSRKEADRLLMVFMKLRDTPLIQAFAIWASVRAFGWMFYRKRK